MLDKILDLYKDYRNPITGIRPKIILAGGGEPLLHRDFIEIIEKIRSYDFSVTLITNGSRLHKFDNRRLIASLNEVLVSVWGIYPEEYYLSMGLDFWKTVDNVRRLARAVKGSKTNIAVQSLRTAHTKHNASEFADFWNSQGIGDIRGFGSWWNRGGQLNSIVSAPDAEAPATPDFHRTVWCSDIYFSDTYSWQGDLVLCCCAYFSSSQHVFGNINQLTIDKVISLKQELMEIKRPKCCELCKLPRALRAQQLAGEIAPYLGGDERKMIFAY